MTDRQPGLVSFLRGTRPRQVTLPSPMVLPPTADARHRNRRPPRPRAPGCRQEASRRPAPPSPRGSRDWPPPFLSLPGWLGAPPPQASPPAPPRPGLQPRQGLLPRRGLHQDGPRLVLPGGSRRGAARRGRPADGPQALRRRRSPRRRSSRSAPPTTARSGCGSPTLTFPSGRTADEIVIDDAAGLAWVANLGCIDLNPHPVRADDLDHPDELRVDLDPVPGVEWPQIRDVALVTKAPRRGRPRRLAEDVRLARHPHQRPDRAPLDVRGGPARGAGDRPRRRGARAAIATSKWWKEERHGVFLDYNQNAKDRPSRRRTPSGRCPTPASRSRSAGRRSPTSSRGLHDRDGARRSTRSAATPGAGIDDAVGSLEAVLELSARHEAEGMGDAPWPPTTPSRRASRRASSRRRPAGRRPSTRRAVGDRRRPAAGGRRGASRGGRGRRSQRRPADRVGGHATDADGPAQDEHPGHRDQPGGDQGRGARRPRALEGPPPRRGRHLEPADVLVDGMRGRSSLWYRVRVNLIHVPEADRPAQEPLDPDYDPWAGYEWPDRTGQLERAPRRSPAEVHGQQRPRRCPPGPGSSGDGD